MKKIVNKLLFGGNKIAKGKVKGFMGFTHVQISFLLFLLIYLFPFDFVKSYVESIKPLQIFFPVLFIVAGSALLPDLDNGSDKSTASYQLGFIGRLLSTGMQAICAIVLSLFRMKDDRKPVSMHRYLWHTPFVSISITLLFWFCIEDGNVPMYKLMMDAYKTGTIPMFLINNLPSIICIFVSFVAIKLGFNMLSFVPLKFIPIDMKAKLIIQNAAVAILTGMVFMMNASQLKFAGAAIGIGWLFHILGDAITQGSAPLIWPIPKFWGKKRMWWYNPWILGPAQIYTGGLVNKIIDFALIGINGVLFYFVLRDIILPLIGR